MLLTVKAVKIAAKSLIVSAIIDEIENKDTQYELSPNVGPVELAGFIMRAESETVLYTMGRYIGEISNKWGHDVGLVFYHMGLRPNLISADEIDARAGRLLYLLIMSCWGHGIGIGDDYAAEFNTANSVLNRLSGKTMAESPVDFDQHETWTGVFVDRYLQQRKYQSEVRLE